MVKNNLFDCSQEVAIVTGGLGQLGAQYCQSLLKAGAKVAAFDILPMKGNNRLAALKGNKKFRFYRVDLTNKKDIIKTVKKLQRDLGDPTVLVNNAALDSPPHSKAQTNGPFETYPETLWDQIMTVNLKSVFLISQVVGEIMARNKKGSIINISSIYGLLSPNQQIYEYRRRKGEIFYKPVAYSVSKSGLYNFSRYLATYWADKNVRVNTLTLAGVFNNQDPEFLTHYNRQVPLKRMARENEYNGAVVFLASPASAYMTGSNLVIDGGYSAW